MTWRVISRGGRQWRVTVAAERRSSSPYWSLVFCFRSRGERTRWAMAPGRLPSKAAVYRQAEAMADDAILGLLSQTADAGRPM